MIAQQVYTYCLFYFGHFNHHGCHGSLLVAMERWPGTGWCWPRLTGPWWTRWSPAKRATPTSPSPATPPSSWTWCWPPWPSPSSPPRPRWCWVRRSASSALWPGRGQSPSSSGWARSPAPVQRFSTKWVFNIFVKLYFWLGAGWGNTCWNPNHVYFQFVRGAKLTG